VPAPTNASSAPDERRLAFHDSVRAYARNKVVGEFGAARLRRSTGLQMLAGMA
jgi:hypothetical protein